MGKKILVVEDDSVARRSMERLISGDPRLAILDPQVVQAATGQQGLAVFVAERPDLIITDLYMPAMDGFAFCRALREAPFGKEVPIIVTSGIYKDPSLAQSLSAEVQACFLPKPIEPDDLVRTVLICLGQTPPASVHAHPLNLQAPEAEPLSPAGAEDARPTEPRDVVFDLSGLGRPPSSPSDAQKQVSTKHGQANVMPPNPLGSGLLTNLRPARLIFDLADTPATGTLSLAHGKVLKDLYVRDGHVVAADSNLRQEALGTLLCAKGIIDEGQLTFLLSETKRRGHKMGAVLVELGWLSPEEVLQCLAAQARKRIVDSLRWNEGSYAFSPGDTFGERIIEHDLDVAKTIFLGLYRSATPEMLVERFDQSGDRSVQLLPRFSRYQQMFSQVFGGDIAHVIADGPSVGALSLRDDAHVVMAEIEALIETGLAVLGAPVVESASSPRALESSYSLDKLGSDLSKRFEAIVSNAAEVSFSEIRKSDVLPSVGRPGFSQSADESPSGALDIGYRPKPERHTPTYTVQTTPSNLRQDLLHEYLMIHGKSHYDVLGVPTQAATSQIEAAVRSRLGPFSDASVAQFNLTPAEKGRLDAVRTAILQAGQVLSNPVARAEYDRALVVTRNGPDPLGAELAFGEALQLFQTDHIEEAVAKFEAAVTARPDQALYHAYLGWADFVAHGPSQANDARERLQHALALDPDLAEAHTMLGRLAATEDDAQTAREHLERSLSIDPDQPETAALLIEAYGRLPGPDPRGAERFLRKLVSALGERAEALRKRLWIELGQIYENHLGDRHSARIAYDMAARLAPRNIEDVRKSVELNAEDPARWRETARALAAEWQLHPHETVPATKLLTLFEERAQADSVAVTAAAMVLRGVADERVIKVAEGSRPKSLPRLQMPLPADLLARAGYRPDEADLETLAALLVEYAVLKPFTREELGLLECDLPLPVSAQPEAFRGILKYVCGLFDVGVPKDIIGLPVLGADARMADLSPPGLLCGQALLATDDTVELGFRLSRAIALCVPGRLAGSARSGGQMRPYFIAALALANAAGPVQGPVAIAASRAIAALDDNARGRILETAQTIKRKYDNLNLSVWGRGLSRLATRLSLLVSGDLLRVGRAVAEEEDPKALDDLLTFALSFDYLDLRQELV
jgi:CheY-like chemotaxis protein/tetratricopeptide (TPR) repeat protein